MSKHTRARDASPSYPGCLPAPVHTGKCPPSAGGSGSTLAEHRCPAAAPGALAARVLNAGDKRSPFIDPCRAATRGAAGCLLPAPGRCRAALPAPPVPNSSPGTAGRDAGGWAWASPRAGRGWAVRLTPLSLAFQMQVIGFPAGIADVALPRPGARTVLFFPCSPHSPSPWQKDVSAPG